MPSIALLRRLHRKANRAAIAMRGRLAVERLRDAEGAGGRAIKIAVHHTIVVVYARRDTERAQHRVIKLLGSLQIIHT